MKKAGLLEIYSGGSKVESFIDNVAGIFFKKYIYVEKNDSDKQTLYIKGIMNMAKYKKQNN